jgi:hypothetical protein
MATDALKASNDKTRISDEDVASVAFKRIDFRSFVDFGRLRLEWVAARVEIIEWAPSLWLANFASKADTFHIMAESTF